MIRIIDSTLAMLDTYDISNKYILQFCELMKKIGITDLEISEKIYEQLDSLPEGIRFYIVLDVFNQEKYKGINYFIYHRTYKEESSICQLQLNDVREIIQIKSFKDAKYIRIMGLDDMLAHKYISAMENIKTNAGNSRINFCPENSMGCAVALAVQWILSGNSEITTSFTGCGNRAATEEVMLALRIATRYKINQDFSAMAELKKLYEEMTGEKISSNKPIIGDEIFDFEAGIHVDGIIKNPTNYVPFLPDQVGQKFRIKIGKHSGRNSIRFKLKKLGIKIEEENQIKSILMQVKLQGARCKRGLNNKEFLGIVKEVLAYEGKEMDC